MKSLVNYFGLLSLIVLLSLSFTSCEKEGDDPDEDLVAQHPAG